MRGKIVIDMEVPSQGLIANLPPHKVPNGGLLPGSSNVFTDLDGLTKTRQGYGFLSQLAVVERPIGIFSYLDYDGENHQIVQSLTRWQLYDSSTQSFTDISGAAPNWNNASADDQGQFTTLPNNNLMWVYGCNGVDPIRAWHVGLGHYITVNGANAPTSCIDMTVLNNRLVVVNTVESGVNYFYRVRWSAVNDGQTWPAGGLADLLDDSHGSEAITAIVNTSRTSAIIYRTASAWSINAIGGGSDSYAYSFERIPVADNMNGPAGPSAVVVAEGLQYYLGLDGRVYAFDGIGIYPISAPIDAVLGPAFSTGFATRVNGVYLAAQRSIWWFVPTGGSEEPTTGICFNLARQVFEPLATFAEPMTCSGNVIEQTGLTWLNWVPLGYTWPDVTFTSWSSIPSATSLGAWSGTANGNMNRFFVATTDAGQVIPYTMVFPMMRPSTKVGINVTHIELYLQQASNPEAVTAVLQGFFQPMWNAPINIVNIAIELANQDTFALRLEPGPNNPANLITNLLQLVISSAGNQAGMVFAGAAIWVNEQERGDYIQPQNSYPGGNGSPGTN